jgi:hypothetical protein
MSYTRAPFPSALFKKLKAVAADLGYQKRASHWQLIDFLLDYAQTHKELFKRRN